MRILFLSAFVSVCLGQNTLPTARDNLGTEFYIGFGPNLAGSNDVNQLFIATRTVAASVRIVCPILNYDKTYNIPAKTVKSFDFSPSIRITTSTTSEVKRSAIYIKATQEVAVYGLNKRKATTDGFMALPLDIKGTAFVTGAYRGLGSYPGFVLVVGTEDKTEVSARIKATSTVSFQGRSYGSGSWLNTTINKYDVLAIKATDITGTEVFSSKTVSVFSGAACANVPTGATACDHLVEQIPPRDTLGKKFGLVPLATRKAGDLYRVVASEDNTKVTLNGQTKTVNRGAYLEYDLSSTTYALLTSDKPVLVLQFSKGQSTDRVNTDPFMMMIPPMEQFASDYRFATPDPGTKYFTSYITLVVEAKEKAGLRLDGKALPNPVWKKIPGTTKEAAYFTVSIGSHEVYHTNPTVTFALYMYGSASYDSYGNPGGARFAAIAAPCKPTKMVPADGIDNDCDGKIDEELQNGKDDDGDGKIDEDIAALPPRLNVPKNVVQTQCKENGSPTVTGTATAQAFGRCAPATTPTYRDTASASGCQTIIKRTWTVKDKCGQVTTGVQTITNSVPAPTVTFPKDLLNWQCSKGFAESATGSPTYKSQCFTKATIKASAPAVTRTNCEQNGADITRQWTVTEPCGRVVTGKQRIVAKPLPTTTTSTTTSSTTSSTTSITTSTTTTPVPTTQPCRNKAADIIFALDSSGSITLPNYNLMKQFVADTVKQLDVGANTVRIGLIRFSNVVTPSFQLNTFSTKTDIVNAILKTPHDQDGTRTHQAMEYLKNTGFTAANGGRSQYKVPALAIIITDGKSAFPSYTISKAAELKAQGVKVLAIGISNLVDQQELVAISSGPQYVFNVENFQGLSLIKQSLADLACRTIVEPPAVVASSTPAGCVDRVDCHVHGQSVCTDYAAWAKDNCACFCGFCTCTGTQRPCVDVLSDCDQYGGKDVCTNPEFHVWVQKNCRKYCGVC